MTGCKVPNMLYLALVFVLLAGGAWVWLRRADGKLLRERAERAAGTFAQRFVVVEDDGGVRELNFLEVAELNREYDPQDMARPRFKSRHDSLNPAGTLWGILIAATCRQGCWCCRAKAMKPLVSEPSALPWRVSVKWAPRCQKPLKATSLPPTVLTGASSFRTDPTANLVPSAFGAPQTGARRMRPDGRRSFSARPAGRNGVVASPAWL